MERDKKKVILVDDEKAVVESISKVVAWEFWGFSLADTCLNAFQALDAIRRVSPDIVITDIKMPVMDGIQLIQKTREFNEQVIFIILSGYGEFELAKRAMKEGVREFLLKPCSEEEIIEALNNSCRPGDEELPEERMEADRDFVDTILHYLDRHYAEETINLKWVARELVFLNEDYIGKRFRQRTGRRFTSYLNEVRVDKAKEYLKTCQDAANDQIAAKVGFGNNPKYFEKVFKKYVGCTPKEYKKRIHTSK